MTFYRPKDSQDPDLVEVYAPFCGPESSKQFPPPFRMCLYGSYKWWRLHSSAFNISVTSFHSHLFNLRMVFAGVDFKLHQAWHLVNLQHLFMMLYKIFHHQLSTSSWSVGVMNFEINSSTNLKEDSEEHIHSDCQGFQNPQRSGVGSVGVRVGSVGVRVGVGISNP